MDDALAVLRGHLEKPKRNKRTPARLDKELKRAVNTTVIDFQATLLKEGFEAWYAYFCATEPQRAIVQQLSHPELQNLAKELCEIVPHQDVKYLFGHVFWKAKRASSRRGKLRLRGLAKKKRSDNVEIGWLVKRGYHCPPSIGIRKRQRTHPEDSPDATARTMLINVSPVPSMPSRPISVQAEGDAVHGSFTADQSETLPFAKYLHDIFPPLLSSSIVREGDRAQIEVTQSENLKPSRLRLSILPQKIPYITQALFHVCVEIHTGHMPMHFHVENGATLKMRTVILGGAKHDALEQYFGRQITDAIRESSTFSTEVERGWSVTNCVALEINVGTRFPYCLSLELDPESLSTIAARIWPPAHP